MLIFVNVNLDLQKILDYVKIVIILAKRAQASLKINAQVANKIEKIHLHVIAFKIILNKIKIV